MKKRRPAAQSPSEDKDKGESFTLPPEMPAWGIKLFELLQMEFRKSSKSTDEEIQTNVRSIKQIERKLAKVELQNQSLEEENVNLKEKLLEIDFKQRRNNLIFEGVQDSEGESDRDTIMKLRNLLKMYKAWMTTLS